MSASLREKALRLLARREHSRAELRRKLARHAEDEADLERLLDDLTASRLLSDVRYAEQRVEGRSARFGNAKLAQELRASGIDDELIDSTLDEAGDEVTRAATVWRKKFAELPADRNAWLKQARFLQSRGFSSDTIRRVLKRNDDDFDE